MALYDTSTSVCVRTFLTRKYGNPIGNQVYETKNVSEEDIAIIEKFVLPKPPKPVPELDLENEQTRLDAVRYMVRAYGEKEGKRRWLAKEYTIVDKKMIHTMGKLFERYNRACLERLNINVTDFITNDLHVSTIKTVIPTCKAFKMNGEQCTAKVKQNGLCMRHSKKV